MLVVGCQHQGTEPLSATVGANESVEAHASGAAPHAKSSAEQQAEQGRITVHLAQLKAGPELSTIDLGEGKKLYALPQPVLSLEDMEGVTAFTSKEGKTFLIFDLTEQGGAKLAAISTKAKGHFFLFGAAGQLIGISQIDEPMTEGKLVMATQDAKHTEQVMQLLR
ncbi:MAG: hypothetical protein RBR45_14755 [Pseudomonas sp.]|jgi:hypothetical protein|nr:hypothetical protein [Pseudomonas sp.]